MSAAPARRPALHQAVHDGRVAEVEALLASGHDPNERDERGQPPLAYALPYVIGFVLDEPTERIIRALLAAGADPALEAVGRRLVGEAKAMVCSALEANEARRLAALLGVNDATT
jgi:hypothetical protein